MKELTTAPNRQTIVRIFTSDDYCLEKFVVLSYLNFHITQEPSSALLRMCGPGYTALAHTDNPWQCISPLGAKFNFFF